MRVTREKNCHCYTCRKDFHYLGITRHRAMHKRKRENCKISYTNGDTYIHKFSELTDKVNSGLPFEPEEREG